MVAVGKLGVMEEEFEKRDARFEKKRELRDAWEDIDRLAY